MTDPLIQISHDVGYTKGKVDALVVENAEAHKELKVSLEKAAENVVANKSDLLTVHTELALHAANIVKLTERVDVVEKKQKYVDSLAKFVTSHPKIVIGAMISMILLITGYGAEELLKLLG